MLLEEWQTEALEVLASTTSVVKCRQKVLLELGLYILNVLRTKQFDSPSDSCLRMQILREAEYFNISVILEKLAAERTAPQKWDVEINKDAIGLKLADKNKIVQLGLKDGEWWGDLDDW